jgi:hypothetical protein
MNQIPRTGVVDRRSGDRDALGGAVVVRFGQLELVGPGQNISPEGVFFVADTSLRVSVSIEGEAEPREGELVRVQTMGEGRVGVAIRFIGPGDASAAAR